MQSKLSQNTKDVMCNMTKITLNIILLLFVCLNVNAQKESEYQICVTKAESLFFIGKTKSFATDYFNLGKNSRDWLTIRTKLYEANYDELNNEFNKFLESLKHDEKRIITNQIDVWFKISLLINFPYDLEQTELLEYLEIVSELEQTKKIIDQFIVVEGQYWGSLSTGQATEAYFEIMEHLFKMSDKEKLKFFKDYYSLAYEKGNQNIN